MNIRHIITISSICLGVSTAVTADEQQGKERPEFRPPPRISEEQLKRYDTNGDGKLSPKEHENFRKKNRTEHGARLAERLKRFDADGNGKLSEKERQTSHQVREKNKKHFEGKLHHHRQRALENFDIDGDGELSEQERKKARENMSERMRHFRDSGEQLKKNFMQTYDQDKDGTLSDQERHTAKEKMSELWKTKKAMLITRFDADGSGDLSPEEHEKARQSKHQEMLKKFDADADGTLSEQEKKVAVKEMLENDPAELLMMMKHRVRGSE